MAEAGRRGAEVRSDCWVKVEPGGSGVSVKLSSNVAAMYGRAIREQVERDMGRMGVADARVEIEDAGALPFVISARLEAAALRAGLTLKGPALPEARAPSPAPTGRDRLRRSRLYLPGDQPKFFVNAGLYGPDGVILDLEDSVAPSEKDAARVLVRNALLAVDFMGAEIMVRINQLPVGLDDLEWVVPHGAQMLLIPKCESADEVAQTAARVAELAPPGPVLLMPIIESPLGCFNALDIARGHESVAALAFGLEDYSAELGADRDDPDAALWARSQVVNAARAAGLGASDTVFADVDDLEGLREAALAARRLGFDGKGCIHPRQISVVHEAFAPGDDELARAREIVLACERARGGGLGVVALGSKMIDAPVLKRALRTVELAVRIGRLPNDWREVGS